MAAADDAPVVPGRPSPRLGRRAPAGAATALGGLASIFVYHLPRLAFLGLQVLYFRARYGDQAALTASPVEHLRRARRLLGQDNSHLLYAAIEVRFALERLAQRELLFNDATSIRDLDETRPVKMVKALRRAAPDSAHPHRVVMTNHETGEQFEFGRYQPLDADRASKLDGRLGNLLHPKLGLNLGLIHDPWYQTQRSILLEGIKYLEPIAKASPFTLFDEMPSMSAVRIEQDEPAN